MNLCIITAQIIRKPKLYLIQNKSYISLVLSVMNEYNGTSILFGYQNIDNINNYKYLYKQYNNIICEGYLYRPKICSQEKTVIKNYYKQYLWIKVFKIY